MIPNHSSDEHPWFVKSAAKEEPYSDYYVWNNTGDATTPPDMTVRCSLKTTKQTKSLLKMCIFFCRRAFLVDRHGHSTPLDKSGTFIVLVSSNPTWTTTIPPFALKWIRLSISGWNAAFRVSDWAVSNISSKTTTTNLSCLICWEMFANYWDLTKKKTWKGTQKTENRWFSL